MTPRFILYILLLFCSIIYGIKRYKLLLDWQKLLVWIIITVLFFELLGKVFAFMFQNSMPSYHFLLPAYFVIYSVIYFKNLEPMRLRKLLIWPLTSLSLIASIINTLFIQNVFVFPSNGILILSFVVILYTLISFYKMLKNTGQLSPLKDSFFWFVTGNLFFYSMTFFVFGYFNPLLETMGYVPDWGYNIIYFSNLVMYLCYFKCLTVKEEILNSPDAYGE